ncbi:MAG: GNAT family N-acetyltransferase [Mobilitalea sp.]
MSVFYDDELTVTDYNNLRESAGWCMLPEKQIKKGLDRSDYVIAAKEDGKTIGMARVFSDSGCVFFVSDVVVLPEYQGKGIGKSMVQSIMTYINNQLEAGDIAYVALMAATGKEEFYEKFGFEVRPNNHHGAGMSQWMYK